MDSSLTEIGITYLPSLAASIALITLAVTIYRNKNLYGLLLNANKRKIKRSIILSEKVKLLSIPDFSFALQNLFEYVEEQKPDYIIGVNRGGTLTASIIAMKLNVHRRNFFRCYSGTEGVSCDDINMEGVALLIDDISRSGDTLSKARDYFIHKYGDSLILRVATLAAVTNELGVPNCPIIDFSAVATNSEKLTLPWRSGSTSQKTQFETVEKESLDNLAKTATGEIASRLVIP